MSLAFQPEQDETTLLAATVRPFRDVPPWIAAALDAPTLMAALKRHVPEFASGALTLQDCAIDQLHLKNGKAQWERTWVLTVAGPEGHQQVPVRFTLTAPGAKPPAPPEEMLPFGAEEWRVWLPEVHMLGRRWPSKRRKSLPAVAQLSDPNQARDLLQEALRAQAEGYADVTIRSCAPKVLRDKPGSSAIVRYQLDYALAGEERNWLDVMIAKLYHDDTGRNAFAGMKAVWDAGLKTSSLVRVAEPLAYLADQQTTLQGPVPEERDLEQMLSALLMSDDPADRSALHAMFRATGMALAALHTCGATSEHKADWSEGFAEAQEQLAWLQVPFPNEIAAVERLVELIRLKEASEPADAAVPSHGAFRPEQVLLHSDKVGIIDFDYFCMAEPAYDLALFRASVMDTGLYDEAIRPHDDAEIALRLERIDAVNESFLQGYQALAPVSRQRVALWEAIYYINDTLQCWTKPRPDALRLVVPVLERHIQTLKLAAH